MLLAWAVRHKAKGRGQARTWDFFLRNHPPDILVFFGSPYRNHIAVELAACNPLQGVLRSHNFRIKTVIYKRVMRKPLGKRYVSGICADNKLKRAG